MILMQSSPRCLIAWGSLNKIWNALYVPIRDEYIQHITLVLGKLVLSSSRLDIHIRFGGTVVYRISKQSNTDIRIHKCLKDNGIILRVVGDSSSIIRSNGAIDITDSTTKIFMMDAKDGHSREICIDSFRNKNLSRAMLSQYSVLSSIILNKSPLITQADYSECHDFIYNCTDTYNRHVNSFEYNHFA